MSTNRPTLETALEIISSDPLIKETIVAEIDRLRRDNTRLLAHLERLMNERDDLQARLSRANLNHA